MKKIVALLLIILFAANVSGATLSYHFCGKILQYFALDLEKKKGTCCCGSTGEKKKSCCKTKHCKVVVDECKAFAKHLQLSKQVIATAIVPAPVGIVHLDIQLVNADHIVPPAHAPPLLRTVPLHILYQQFLI